MISLAEAIWQQLVDTGMTDVYITEAPDHDSAIVISPYSSTTDGDIPLSNVGIQIMSRAVGYAESRAQAWTAFHTLLRDFPANCDREVKSVSARQDPYLLMTDEKGRYIHVFSLSYICGWKE